MIFQLLVSIVLAGKKLIYLAVPINAAKAQEINECNGRVCKASRLLGIHRTVPYRKTNDNYEDRREKLTGIS
ncbi:hypothetical protein REC12_08245 [Desulfosporosinus sp. PR]|nr:hypothetical protein [Desulfosporosinus sp. PR]